MAALLMPVHVHGHVFRHVHRHVHGHVYRQGGTAQCLADVLRMHMVVARAFSAQPIRRML